MANYERKVQGMIRAMRELARVASAVVDGDEAGRIITDLAMHYIANPDNQFRFLAGDYYDVDFAAFLRTKKLLMRLERLLSFRCDITLWMRVKGRPDLLTVAVHNGTLSRWYEFGAGSVRIDPTLTACLDSGEIVVAELNHPSETLTVLAPVRDSLGDVVGLLELTALHPGARRLPPAWN
ncbi:MAG: hypothetical protein ACUVWX_01775 [Kiritimatiellia bacterium]